MSRGEEPGLHRSACYCSAIVHESSPACGEWPPNPVFRQSRNDVRRVEGPPIGEEISLPVTPADASESLRLVLVEDSEDDARLILHELHREGFNVTARRVDTPHPTQDSPS